MLKDRRNELRLPLVGIYRLRQWFNTIWITSSATSSRIANQRGIMSYHPLSVVDPFG